MNNKKGILNRLLAGAAAAVMTLSMLPQQPILAAQSGSGDYVNPADNWISTSSRANEFDLNATKTEETSYCLYCEQDTIFDIFRVPEYADNGNSAALQGVEYTDGKKGYGYGGTEKMEISDPNPKHGSLFTKHHWVKSCCQKCKKFNINVGISQEINDEWYNEGKSNDNVSIIQAVDKNWYILYDCDANFFTDFDLTEYEVTPNNSATHSYEAYNGKYCMFCKGTTALRQATVTEAHDMNYTLTAEEGNHRFKTTGVCDLCGYTLNGYSIAKSVVADYYGVADGAAHTVTVADFSDSDVTTSILYGDTANDITQPTAPNFTEAGSYSVWYEITYTISYSDKKTKFKDIGEAKVVLYNDMSLLTSAGELAGTTGDEHSHNYVYRYRVAPTCTTIGYEIWQCETCGLAEQRNYTDETGHDYEAMTLRDATCQQDGVILHECRNCGACYKETIPKADHTYYREQISATCTMPGYTKVTCSVCGYTYTESITAVKGHRYIDTVTAPTCTAMGYTTHTCADCGDSYADSYTPAAGHKWDSGHALSEAGCTGAGITEYACLSCGATRLESVSASGHTALAAATCTEPQLCADCGAVLASALGHTYRAEVTAPTCTTRGFTTYTCMRCGDSYTDDYVDAKEHHFHEFVTEPTCTALGYTTFICTNCGYEYKDSYTPPAAHTYSKVTVNPTCTAMGYTTYTCGVCGDSYVSDYTDKTPHNYSKVTVNPTCETLGYTIYTCPDCGTAYMGDYTDKAEHHYNSAVTNPTCTEQGYTTHVCSDCGYEYISDYTDPLGHNFKETLTAPTCTKMGFTHYECRRCDFELDGAYTDPLGHDYVETITAPTCTDWGYSTFVCSVCGDSYESNPTDKLPHDYEDTITAPTCTEMGYTTRVCRDCGDTYVCDYTNPLGHDYEDAVTPSTCTELGFTTHTCKVCGDSYVSDEKTLAPHDYEDTVTPSTCTELGYTTRVCRNCGYAYVSDYTNPLGHSYIDTVTAPTCTAMGYTTHTCADCGHSYIDSYTNPKGHDYEKTVTTSTCTDIGYTTNRCKICGNTYISDETAKAAHDFEIVATEPTCTELGYSTYTCRDCGESYRADETAAKGHKTSEWITDTPATIEHSGAKHTECTVCGVTLLSETLPQLIGSDNSDEDGVSGVGAFTVTVTDRDGKAVFDNEVSIDKDDNITVRLADGRVISADDRTDITVVYTDTAAPAKDIYVYVYDENNNTADGRTDADGKFSVPNGASGTGDYNGTITDGVHTFAVKVEDKTGAVIPDCAVSAGDNFSINVKLPDGTAFGRDNRVTVTVVTEHGEPVNDLRVQVIGDGDHIENGYTNANGQVTLPISNQALTDSDGSANVGEIISGTIYDYIVTVNDERGYIRDALITLDAANETVLVCLPAGKTIGYDNRITVTVVDSDLKPVENWSVTVYNKDGSGERTEITDENGRVIVPPLSEAPISKPSPTPEPSATPKPGVELPTAEPTPSNAPVQSAEPTVTVKPSEVPVQSEQPTASAAPIQSAQPTASAAPVQSAQPTATPRPTAAPVPTANPDDEPSNVKDRTHDYKVYVWDNDGQIAGDAQTGLVKLLPDGNLEISLPDGKKLDALNRTNILVYNAKDDTPVKGITVTVTDKTGVFASDVTDGAGYAVVPATGFDYTDADGNARVTDRDGNAYGVNVSSEDGKPVEGAKVTVADGKITAELPDGRTLDYDDRTKVTVTDNGNAPVKDMSVTVSDYTGAAKSGNTGEDGSVILPPHTEDVTDTDGIGKITDGMSAYTVTVEQEQDGAVKNAAISIDGDGVVTVVLPDGRTIDYRNRTTVTVTDALTSEPAADVIVSVRDNAGGIRIGTTSALGKLTVPPLNEDMTNTDGKGGVTDKKDEAPDPSATAEPKEEHSYSVTVRDEDGEAIKGAVISVDDGGDVNVRLPDGETFGEKDRITVTVADSETGEPLENVFVTVEDKSGNSASDTTDSSGTAVVPAPQNTGVTDADGKTSVGEKHADGAVCYAVTVENGSGKIENAQVTISDGKIYVVLPAGKKLLSSNQTVVTVTDLDGVPASGVSVSVKDETGKTATKTTDSDGQVRVPASSSGGSGGGSGGGGGSSTASVGYTIAVTDKDGKTVSAVKTGYTTDGVTLTLPAGKALDDDNYYTVTVKDKNGAAKAGYGIILKTKDGKVRLEAQTDRNGTAVIPSQGEEHKLYVVGYDDGEFKPDGCMTRAEAAAIFARLIADEKGEAPDGKPTFADITDKKLWYYGYIGYVEKYGVIKGYEDGTFKPDGKITRAEFVAMTVRFHKLFDDVSYGKSTKKYSDVSDGFWYVKDISFATDAGWLNGYADGTFKPDANISRAEVVTVVNNALGREADKEYINKNLERLEKFTDLKTNSHWAFYDIVEAANTHTGKTSESGEIWKD